MKLLTVILIAFTLASPNITLAENKGSVNPTHKYWTCTISSYYSMLNGKHQAAQCLANTEYSEPPCREFVVEYEGPKGVRPNVPYQQKVSPDTFEKSAKATQPMLAKIEINQDKDNFIYKHTIEQAGASTNNAWVYSGVCHYNEAPASEKIYMDYGLKTTR